MHAVHQSHALCTMHMHHAHLGPCLMASWLPEAPLGHLVPGEVALGILLVHEDNALALQSVSDLVGLLEVGHLARLIALLNQGLDLLVGRRPGRPLAARDVRAGLERRAALAAAARAAAEERGALLGNLHRQLGDGLPLLLAVGPVVVVDLLELGLGVLDCLVEGGLVAARDAQGQGLLGLVLPSDALSPQPRLPAVLLEPGLLPDGPGDLDDAAADPELSLVLDAHLELAGVLLGAPSGIARRAPSLYRGHPQAGHGAAHAGHGRHRRHAVGVRHLVEHRVVRALAHEVHAEESFGHARKFFLVEVVLGRHRLVRLPKLHLRRGALGVDVHLEDIAVPGEDLAHVVLRELVFEP
mmetsp:Transcript_111789/g.303464  ORF Transcript_111789/g.303464 Transcript_111789/m.303464 type:complete len:355 (+) Transcript_111789:266-1330(+)